MILEIQYKVSHQCFLCQMHIFLFTKFEIFKKAKSIEMLAVCDRDQNGLRAFHFTFYLPHSQSESNVTTMLEYDKKNLKSYQWSIDPVPISVVILCEYPIMYDNANIFNIDGLSVWGSFPANIHILIMHNPIYVNYDDYTNVGLKCFNVFNCIIIELLEW